MIRKLKRKFMIINMSFVAVVLLIVFVVMLYTSASQYEREAKQALTYAFNHKSGELDLPPEIGRRGNGPGMGMLRREEGKTTLPTFVVTVDGEGAVQEADISSVTVSAEVLADAVEHALAGNGGGRIPAYGLQYAIRYSSEGTRIAFVDVSANESAMMRQITVSLIVGLCGLTAFFFISMFLSDWALRPTQRAWERQRQFVADASHELKTPLTVILANTDILLAHPERTVEAEKRWVENTKVEGLRMKKLVDDMLFLAKADAAAPPPMEPFSLSDAAWSAILPFETVAFEKAVTIQAQIADGVSITGNAPQLRQLIAILMDNGIKYAGEGGIVTVQLLRKGEGAAIRVNNTGKPIDPDALPHIFERFYRGESARERKTGGYGLGLSIAKAISEMHHGKLFVKSNEAEGTTFILEWEKLP